MKILCNLTKVTDLLYIHSYKRKRKSWMYFLPRTVEQIKEKKIKQADFMFLLTSTLLKRRPEYYCLPLTISPLKQAESLNNYKQTSFYAFIFNPVCEISKLFFLLRDKTNLTPALVSSWKSHVNLNLLTEYKIGGISSDQGPFSPASFFQQGCCKKLQEVYLKHFLSNLLSYNWFRLKEYPDLDAVYLFRNPLSGSPLPSLTLNCEKDKAYF